MQIRPFAQLCDSVVSTNRTPEHLCHTPAVVFVTCLVPHAERRGGAGGGEGTLRDYIIFPRVPSLAGGKINRRQPGMSGRKVLRIVQVAQERKCAYVCSGPSGHLNFQRSSDSIENCSGDRRCAHARARAGPRARYCESKHGLLILNCIYKMDVEHDATIIISVPA